MLTSFISLETFQTAIVGLTFGHKMEFFRSLLEGEKTTILTTIQPKPSNN